MQHMLLMHYAALHPLYPCIRLKNWMYISDIVSQSSMGFVVGSR